MLVLAAAGPGPVKLRLFIFSEVCWGSLLDVISSVRLQGSHAGLVLAVSICVRLQGSCDDSVVECDQVGLYSGCNPSDHVLDGVCCFNRKFACWPLVCFGCCLTCFINELQ